MARPLALLALVVCALSLGGAARAADPAPPAWIGLVANNQYPFDNTGTFDAQGNTFTGNIGVGGDNTWVGVTPDGTRGLVSVIFPAAKLAVIDPSAGTALDPATGTMPADHDWGAVSPDGTLAYLSGNNSVVPVDLTASPPQIKDPIAVTGAGTIAFLPDGSKAYVTNGAGVVPIDVAASTAGTAIPVAAGTFGIAVEPDGSTLWVANHDAQTVTPVDVASGTAGTPVPAGGHPYELAASGDGSRVYASLREEHKL